MSKLYHCILCQSINASIMDLHNHHVQQHTLEELSCTIIDLQGLQFNKQKYLKSIILNNNNNNKNLCDPFVIKTEKSEYHDETYCSLHCSPFIAWEQELNKRIDITDDDFFSIVDNFCSDLSKRKQSGRKRKNKATTSDMKSEENLIQSTENEKIKTENQISQEFNCLPMQISEIPSSSSEHSVHNMMVNNEISQTQMNIQSNIEYDNIAAATVLDMKCDEDFLIYDPLNGGFSWASIISRSSDEK